MTSLIFDKSEGYYIMYLEGINTENVGIIIDEVKFTFSNADLINKLEPIPSDILILIESIEFKFNFSRGCKDG